MTIVYNDGGRLECSTIEIFGNQIVADGIYTAYDYEVDHIEG